MEFRPEPLRLPQRVYQEMAAVARVLHRANCRILEELAHDPASHPALWGEGVRGWGEKMSGRVVPLFWARYTFNITEKGMTIFSAFNCRQAWGRREAAAAGGEAYGTGVYKGNFVDAFLANLQSYWARYGNGETRPQLGVLVDPAYYQEMHLAHLYCRWISDGLKWPCRIIGARNITVSRGRARAWREPVDFVLAQFPPEYAGKIPAFPQLLKLHRQGKILYLNDPLVLNLSTDSLIAYYWRLAQEGRWLTGEEEAAVKKYLPYTVSLEEKDYLEQALRHRGRWVLKGVAAPYDQRIWVGNHLKPPVWGEALQLASQNPAGFILQEFRSLPPQRVEFYQGGNQGSKEAMVNFALYFFGEELAGVAAHIIPQTLGGEGETWFAPVSVQG